ncbi:YdcF family protein [Picrophilus oshimae]|uniref:Uncharacterized SAM-binding protein YcdF, DUF218 family n=1 Tax=Picrophilus torridus (strain ATCC 700027 / DSM 9790 / JCM 10055 / NBRC 100828 / KAW 2/3) TaxID=1122961 RepID=A0A8G2FXS4_PICTO|nr:YdcF family protein [Picrophilus oshimae]SMD31411.1 Uncharacterized SAM-binding protein YcdF, DUF218 family [Picrophilus oshimae DSM 9789]
MDILIVLGCRLDKNCHGDEITERAKRGAMLLKEHPEAVAIASGGITNIKCRSEASFIADVINHSIDKDIILEERSTSTIGNAFYTGILLKEYKINVSRIYIVTSCYHVKRALMIFSKFFNVEILTECIDYKRDDEDLKYARDYKILEEIGDLNDEKRILENFLHFL